MLLQLVMVIVYMVICGTHADTEINPVFHHTECTPVPLDTDTWKAAVTLSKPIELTQVDGGEVTYLRDDGLYLEIVGRAQTPMICVAIHGTFFGESPSAEIEISPVMSSEPVTTREIRSIRIRRSTEIWRVSSVPETTDRRTLLQAFEPYHHQYGDDSLSGSTKHSSSPALTVHYAQGSYSQTSSMKGAGFYTTPPEVPDGVDDLILMYDVYFENFGFGNMGKLPGLFGGENGEGAYLCSGGNNPSSCFSMRLMWRSDGDGEIYAYIPSNQEPGFNDRPDVIAHSDYGQSIGRGQIKFQNGVWQTVLEQVNLNSIGQHDGRIKMCNQVSGQSQVCYEATNLLMRNDPNHHIRGMFFSTFFGGSNPADAAPNDCHTYFKEFRLKIPEGAVVG